MINFKVAKYSKVDDKFILDGYEEFDIQFRTSLKLNRWIICVNGMMTDKTVVIHDPKAPVRSRILSAISSYVNNEIKDKSICKKFITQNQIDTLYSKNIKKIINHHILTVTKEEDRDRLTLYNLILKRD